MTLKNPLRQWRHRFKFMHFGRVEPILSVRRRRLPLSCYYISMSHSTSLYFYDTQCSVCLLPVCFHDEAEEGRRGLWGIRISLLARVSRIYKCPLFCRNLLVCGMRHIEGSQRRRLGPPDGGTPARSPRWRWALTRNVGTASVPMPGSFSLLTTTSFLYLLQ